MLPGRSKNIVSETEVETISSNINRRMVGKKTTKRIILMTRYQIDLRGRRRTTIKENILMTNKKQCHMMMKILNIIKITNKIEKRIWYIELEIAQITIMSMVQEVEEAEVAVVKVEVAEEGSKEIIEEINAMIVIEKMKMINMKVNTKMMHQENIIRKSKNIHKLNS